jgi:hypothetical protein
MGHNVTATMARITVVEGAQEAIAAEVFQEEAADSGVAVADAEERRGYSRSRGDYPRAVAAISQTSCVRDTANEPARGPRCSNQVVWL